MAGRSMDSVSGAFKREARAWIDSAPESGRAQRLSVTSAATVEILASTFTRDTFQYQVARDLMEWACAELRRGPVTEFERQFDLASIALMQGARDDGWLGGRTRDYFDRRTGDTHAEHAGRRFPSDTRFRLAYLTSRSEVQLATTWPVSPGTLIANWQGKLTKGDDVWLDETVDDLSKLADDPVVGPEARLRTGVLRFQRLKTAAARSDLAGIATTEDPAIRYMANLVLAAMDDAALRPAEALEHYRAAYATFDAAASSLALASALYRAGAHADALQVLAQSAAQPPIPDPWRLYSQRDYPRFRTYRDAMRQAVAPGAPSVPPSGTSVAMQRTQGPIPPSAGDQILHVIVTSSGEPAAGLTANDFVLLDDGVRQQAVVVDAAKVPLDLAVVVPDFRRRSSESFRTFDDEISEIAQGLGPGDRLRIIVAGDDLRERTFPLVQPAGRVEIERALRESSCAPMYDAIGKALMTRAEPGRRRAVIALAHGEGTGSVLSFDAVDQIARRSPAELDAMMFDEFYTTSRYNVAAPLCPESLWDFSPSSRSRLREIDTAGSSDRKQLELRMEARRRLGSLAKVTGGREIRSTAVTGSRIAPLRDAVTDIHSGYILTYTPKGVQPTGWHPISVSVIRPGDYDVRARPGILR